MQFRILGIEFEVTPGCRLESRGDGYDDSDSVDESLTIIVLVDNDRVDVIWNKSETRVLLVKTRLEAVDFEKTTWIIVSV